MSVRFEEPQIPLLAMWEPIVKACWMFREELQELPGALTFPSDFCLRRIAEDLSDSSSASESYKSLQKKFKRIII